MNTVNNIPEKHLLKTSRELLRNCKIIKAKTKIDILFKNHIFSKNIFLSNNSALFFTFSASDDQINDC